MTRNPRLQFGLLLAPSVILRAKERIKSRTRHETPAALMKYSIWIFTRPLSYAGWFPPLEKTSDGKHHLRHWAILVSEMGLSEMKAILLGQSDLCRNGNTEMGTMYELFRDENNQNNVNITRPFGIPTRINNWRTFSAEHIGDTPP
jgi:hypothetical protein